MENVIYAEAFAATWVVGMAVMMEVGRRVGTRRLARDPTKGMAGLGMIESAVFALLGLMIAFTFSGASSRFDTRRMLLAEEVNDIGTAYLRLDLLPAGARPALRALFRDYVSARLAAYARWADADAAKAELARCGALQTEIWTRAVAATGDPGAHVDATRLLLPALNAMIDITTTRTMAARIHPPAVVYGILFILGLGCALLAGYGMAENPTRSWAHILGFIVLVGAAVFVILDLEYPRIGFIRLDVYDQLLVDLLQQMK